MCLSVKIMMEHSTSGIVLGSRYIIVDKSDKGGAFPRVACSMVEENDIVKTFSNLKYG